MISTLVEQAQRAVGKRFFVIAFLPTVVVVIVGWIQISGLDSIRETVEEWADQGAGRALFDVVATVLALFLAAYVLDSLRWAVRAVFEGSWPALLWHIREWAVLLNIRRRDRRVAALQTTGESQQALEWLCGGEPPEVGPVALTRADVTRALRTAATGLHELTGRGGHRAVDAVARGASSLLLLDTHRDALNLGEITKTDELCAEAKWLTGDRRSAAILRSATVRLEQRRIWLDERLEVEFPQDADIRPTQLGNVIARADGYSATRYGIPLRELWPRLELVAPDGALDQVDDSLSRVDFGLAMATGGATLFLVGSISFLAGGPVFGLVTAVAALAGSVLAYRFAVVSAEAYTLRISAVVDVHRRAALVALGIDPPRTLSAERKTWEDLYPFLARGDEIDLALSTLPQGSAGLGAIGGEQRAPNDAGGVPETNAR